MKRAGLCLSLLLGCATAGQGARRGDSDIAALRNSPVAQEVARAAPEAFAAFAQELTRVESTPEAQREAARVDAEVVLGWAHAVARASIARERAAAATARADAAEQDTRRAEQQVAEIDAELDRAAAERAARERAREAVVRPPATAPARVAAAADLRQQAGLYLAAARLLGADDAARAPAQAALTAAEGRATAPDALPLAGRAMQAAEALVTRLREAQTATAQAPRGDDAALLRSVAETPELDPHRDARGVIAVLRGLFNGVTLVPTARSRLTPLANILRSTAGARARVEVFAGGPAATAVPRARRQAEAMRAALVALGVEASRLESDGVARVAGGARSDDRAEVVLLSP